MDRANEILNKIRSLLQNEEESEMYEEEEEDYEKGQKLQAKQGKGSKEGREKMKARVALMRGKLKDKK